jgi:hypothetical protein
MRILKSILLLTTLLSAFAYAANTIYAVVAPGGSIINLVTWDGVSPFNVSPNTLVSATGQTNAQIGGTYIGGVFTAPAAPAAQQGIIFVNSPTSGTTLALPNPVTAPGGGGCRLLYVYLQPASTLASLTLALPTAPQDCDVINLLSSQAITALTWSPTFQGAPTTLAATASGAKQLTYSAQVGNWFLW